MSIEEGNKLIAEFMGSCGLEKKGTPNMGIVRNHAKYHSSWDCLMPVVEKIVNLYETTVHENIYKKAGKVVNEKRFYQKERLYKSVVEFIQYYNQTTKP